MLIVDGHNVAFADEEAKKSLTGGNPEAARRRVVELVEVYATATGQTAIVVFDGIGQRTVQAEECGRVRCCFSGVERSADLEVVRLLEGSTGRRETCVVTGDRSLLAAARRLGARTLGAKEFLDEVARQRGARRSAGPPEPAGKRLGPSPAEVEYWLKEFSEQDATRIERQERASGRTWRKK